MGLGVQMQRAATRQSPGIDSAAKRHLNWIKQRGICAACNNDGGVIAHHSSGSSAKVMVGLERVMIGHWFILGLCQPCDNIVTRRGRKAFRDAFGNQCGLWLLQAESYGEELPLNILQESVKWWY